MAHSCATTTVTVDNSLAIPNELRRSKLRGINGKAAKRSQQAAGNVPIEIQCEDG